MVKVVKTGKVKTPGKKPRSELVSNNYGTHKKRLDKLKDDGNYEEFIDQHKCGHKIAKATKIRHKAIGKRKTPHTSTQFRDGCESYFKKVEQKRMDIILKNGDVRQLQGKYPMTLQGLMLHLGITDKWWNNYEHGEGFKTFHEIAALARLTIQNNILEGGLMNTLNPYMAEFYLKNVSNMKDRPEQNAGSGIKNITFVTITDRNQLAPVEPDEDIIEVEDIEDEPEYTNK